LIHADFEEGTAEGFLEANLDDYYRCDNVPPSTADIGARVANGIFMIEANVNSREGLYVGAISRHSLMYLPGYQYTASGRFRLATPTQIQTLAVNLNFVRNSIEHPIIFQWVTNSNEPDYGKLRILLDNSTDTWQVTHILPVDETWHSFKLVGSFLTDDTARYNSLSVDGVEAQIDKYTTKIDKDFPTSSDLFIETANLYPNCDGISVHRAISEWDDIIVEAKPLQD
jgi:hypothetical protein